MEEAIRKVGIIGLQWTNSVIFRKNCDAVSAIPMSMSDFLAGALFHPHAGLFGKPLESCGVILLTRLMLKGSKELK